MSLQNFFDNYGRALTARDTKAIAQLWATPSIVLGPDGAIAVSDSSEVEAFFQQSVAQYDGVAAARATVIENKEILPGLLACEVRWDHFDESGARVGGEEGYYVVRQSDSGGVIEVYAPRG